MDAGAATSKPVISVVSARPMTDADLTAMAGGAPVAPTSASPASIATASTTASVVKRNSAGAFVQVRAMCVHNIHTQILFQPAEEETAEALAKLPVGHSRVPEEERLRVLKV